MTGLDHLGRSSGSSSQSGGGGASSVGSNIGDLTRRFDKTRRGVSVAEPGEKNKGFAEGEERDGPARAGVGGDAGGGVRRGAGAGGELNRLVRSDMMNVHLKRFRLSDSGKSHFSS